MLFRSLEGEPQMAQGAMSKAQFEKLFQDILKVEPPTKEEIEDNKQAERNHKIEEENKIKGDTLDEQEAGE